MLYTTCKIRHSAQRSVASQEGTTYETNGGRVLGVTALGEDIKTAIDKAYEACSVIEFEDMHYRRDIGYRAIKKDKVL